MSAVKDGENIPKKVVIVGAGYAGIEAALTLNKSKSDIEIILIDKNPYHTLLTEIHELAGNRVQEEAVRVFLDSIFEFTNVNVILDEIKDFDFEQGIVSSGKTIYTYDYLILAIGSTPNFFDITGLEKQAFTLWSFDDALVIREHVKKCFLLAAQEQDSNERKRLLTFAVAGAGFTGVEMIGELAVWTKGLAKEHGFKYENIRLVIVDMLPQILNSLNAKNARKAHRYMEKKLGIEIMLNTSIKEVTDRGFSTNGQMVETASLIWAAGVRSSTQVEDMPLEKLGGARRLKVDEFGRTEYQNVYTAGDVSCYLDKEGKPYPAMVENAVQTGRAVAKNILHDLKKEPPQKVKIKIHGVMVSVGNYYAVAEIMGRILPVWLSIIMKYLVNIHYLWEITGFRGIARYLYHELLERRQPRLLIEKHWSTRLQAWWLTLLRIFLGWAWLYEGLQKIWAGWLEKPQLATFFGYVTGAPGLNDSNTSAQIIDSMASATPQSAEGTVQTIERLFYVDLGIIQFYLDKAAQMVFKAEFWPVKWFVENIVLASDSSQLFFQAAVVVAEIFIGLALIFGAFTFLAALASLGLMVNFAMTTGLYDTTWWMIFAAIACMGGAGRAFGVDYYLIPYLNNVWEYFWKNRRLKLFFKKCLARPKL